MCINMHVISCADWCAQSDAAPNSRVQDEWYPPGHGDIYRSLSDSGILDELIAQGKEYLFVSNIDNLGSVINYGKSPPPPSNTYAPSTTPSLSFGVYALNCFGDAVFAYATRRCHAVLSLNVDCWHRYAPLAHNPDPAQPDRNPPSICGRRRLRVHHGGHR